MDMGHAGHRRTAVLAAIVAVLLPACSSGPTAPSRRAAPDPTSTRNVTHVSGGHDRSGRMALGDGAVYEPRADRWRPRPVVPKFNVPNCGVADPAGDAYGTEIDPHRGHPGEIVTLFGTTVRGEDGRWADAHRLEAWWNAMAPGGQPLRDGPVFRLVRVGDMRRCEFRARFKVPDVAPGTYRISTFAWEVPPLRGIRRVPARALHGEAVRAVSRSPSKAG
jgi:hypothetical protein